MLGKGRVTRQIFNINASQKPQSVLIVRGVVPNRLVVLAGEIIEAAVNWSHPREIVQHLLNLLNGLLEKGENLFVTGEGTPHTNTRPQPSSSPLKGYSILVWSRSNIHSVESRWDHSIKDKAMAFFLYVVVRSKQKPQTPEKQSCSYTYIHIYIYTLIPKPIKLCACSKRQSCTAWEKLILALRDGSQKSQEMK